MLRKMIEKNNFSIELKGKNINKIHIDSQESLIEGNLGAIHEAVMHENILLEVKGSKGVLRIDIPLELIKAAAGGKQNE